MVRPAISAVTGPEKRFASRITATAAPRMMKGAIVRRRLGSGSSERIASGTTTGRRKAMVR